MRPLKLVSLHLFTLLFVGCASVPFDQPKQHSLAYADTANTHLGKEVREWVAAHKGLSAFYPLSEGMDALGVRLRMAEIAEESIDLQYFLMKNDTAGAVISQSLLKAADRGVRVRFLLDDIFTTQTDDNLLLLNQHPIIEVRLFNPVSRRGWSSLNFVGHFNQANRRMHNKSFTVDNQISVVGGRNIADEYYQLKTESVFLDFDVLVAGSIVREISNSFDDYWNHSRAVPIEYVANIKKDQNLDSLREEIGDQLEDIYSTVYRKALGSQLLQDLMTDRELFYPATAQVLSDRPDKIIDHLNTASSCKPGGNGGQTSGIQESTSSSNSYADCVSSTSREDYWLATALSPFFLGAKQEVVLISPYFVPGDSGVEFIKNVVDKGVRIVIITNSLASNNHIPVHSGYANYRKGVIRAGAELYEARANAAREAQGSNDGPDTLTLHTKVILIDRRYLFVGSLNLDPRSIEINAEMGLLIDSEELVQSLSKDFDERLAKLTYRVELNEKEKLNWRGYIDGEEVVETKEPLTSSWRRFKAWFMKIVPESQL